MARRRKASPAEDIMDLVAMLPWWAGIALAIIGYLWLHKIATTPIQIPAGAGPGQLAGLGPHAVFKGLASAGQFAVPLVCLAGALISFLRRRKRQRLASQVTQSGSAEALNGMSWQEFELLVGEAFRQQGFSVEEKGGSAPDGGVDLLLRKGRETYLVQCKQWKAFKVGVDVVRQLYGVMAATGAAGGFVVTSGTFTADASSFADGRNIKLVDGPQLHGLMRQAKTSGRTAAPASTPAPARRASQVSGVPACPRCNAPMVLRTAAKGTNAGTRFWGCSTYPACKGTRSD